MENDFSNSSTNSVDSLYFGSMTASLLMLYYLLQLGYLYAMFKNWFKKRKIDEAKVRADGDLLIDLLASGALTMAKENAVKSAINDNTENLHHQRVLAYVRKKLGASVSQDYATRILRGK